MPSSVSSKVVKSNQSLKSENTKKEIIESALRLLETKGYSKANLAEIAKGAKITIGALQHHFPTKSVLLEVLVSEVLAPLAISSSSNANVWPNPNEPLEQRAKFFVEQVWDQIYGKQRYIANWSLFLGCRSNKKLFDVIKQHRNKNDPIFNETFLKFFPEIKESTDSPEYFASYIYSTLRGMAIMQIFDPQTEEVRRELDFIIETILLYARKSK